MQNIEWIIKQVDATMTIEDIIIKKEDKKRIRYCIGNNKRVDKEIQKLIQRYSVKAE